MFGVMVWEAMREKRKECLSKKESEEEGSDLERNREREKGFKNGG